MFNKFILTNVADHDIMKDVQLRTFKLLRGYLENSFGPKGSNSAILRSDGVVSYTKDGHSILKAIFLQNPIESSIKSTLDELTLKIVQKVGDGTTSAVILSEIIYSAIDAYLKEHKEVNSYDFSRMFQTVVDRLKADILLRASELTPAKAYDIAHVATNGNDKVAKTIQDIYQKFGNDIYISVGTSTSDVSYIKEYEGLNLECGFDESCYINTSDGKSHIRNPRIFMFSDPIDTREMGSFLDAIVADTMESLNNGAVKPTVIMAPKISVDMSTLMNRVANFLSQQELGEKAPILILGNVLDAEKYDDLRILTGAKYIKKYIDPKIQESDIEKGLAPTVSTIFEFAGHAELVESDNKMTKVVRPAAMYNKDGTYSDEYTSLLSFLEAEFKIAVDTSSDLKERYVLRKRIQSLKGSLVEYLVGGSTMMDRDALKDLVEDAVLNCRSAAEHGYGYAANVEGLIASYWYSKELLNANDFGLKYDIAEIIFNSYSELVRVLIERNTNYSRVKTDCVIQDILKKGIAFDVREEIISENIISSIYSDIYILDTISKIISLMVTSNQFIVPDVQYNVYIDKDKV
jgi:chaperonin GroEL (HSP60 family)